MDRGLSFVVAVDNEIEHIAVFGLYGNELLAAFLGAADIVNEAHIPVRGKRLAARILCTDKHTAEHREQFIQHIGVKGD